MTSILLPTFSMAGLVTVLAIIILVAERYLLDYGELNLRVNDKTFRVRGGNTVLNTLKEQKIFVPSACGGRATCAYCKVKALDGFGLVLPTETPLLTPEDISNNIRLSCQLKIRSDCAIQIPEELFSVREFRARLAYSEDLTYDIKLLTLALIEPEVIDYKAGQYIQFQSPEYGEVSESVYRAYSMSGLCTEKNAIQLMVRFVPEGIATTYIFHHMKPTDEVTFTGPYGDFYLRETGRRMICIAGGSGMAPIRAILLAMSAKEIEERRPIFFFGAKAQRDLFMLNEWREFGEKHANFIFVPALSDPDPDGAWDGETGRITTVVEKYIHDASESEGYLCGSPGLLNACIEALKGLGMPEENIFYDKFT